MEGTNPGYESWDPCPFPRPEGRLTPSVPNFFFLSFASHLLGPLFCYSLKDSKFISPPPLLRSLLLIFVGDPSSFISFFFPQNLLCLADSHQV